MSERTLARSALLAVAALATLGLQPLQIPRPGGSAALLLGIFIAELVLIGVLSPELGEGLVMLGYSEPCELRTLAVEQTLTALRRSAQWRKHSGLITADVPVDTWRELCWRYVVFPSRLAGRDAELVFAVYQRQHRPAVLAALVDSATCEVLPWPAPPPKPARLAHLAHLAHLAGLARPADRSEPRGRSDPDGRTGPRARSDPLGRTGPHGRSDPHGSLPLSSDI